MGPEELLPRLWQNVGWLLLALVWKILARLTFSSDCSEQSFLEVLAEAFCHPLLWEQLVRAPLQENQDQGPGCDNA